MLKHIPWANLSILNWVMSSEKSKLDKNFNNFQLQNNVIHSPQKPTQPHDSRSAQTKRWENPTLNILFSEKLFSTSLLSPVFVPRSFSSAETLGCGDGWLKVHRWVVFPFAGKLQTFLARHQLERNYAAGWMVSVGFPSGRWRIVEVCWILCWKQIWISVCLKLKLT